MAEVSSDVEIEWGIYYHSLMSTIYYHSLMSTIPSHTGLYSMENIWGDGRSWA